MASLLTMVMGLFGYGKASAKEYKTADVYQNFRQRVLTLNPSEIGISPSASRPIWGVLMETGYPEAVVTLVTLADGTVSLYFSNGGGIIGVGEHQEPRKVCNEFLSLAPRFLGQASSAKNFPLPAEGYVRFYFLTFKGILTVEAKENDLGNNLSLLSPLFYKAQEVIAQARIADEKFRVKQQK